MGSDERRPRSLSESVDLHVERQNKYEKSGIKPDLSELIFTTAASLASSKICTFFRALGARCDKACVLSTRPISLTLLLAALFVVFSGCDRPDERLSSPEATIATLFRAYGVEDLPEREAQRMLREQRRFELVDRPSMLETFADFRVDEQEGMLGFVFGRLVARKSSLEIERSGDRAEVRATGEEGSHPIVLIRDGGEWRFSLRESVPAELQRRLFEIHRRALELEKRAVSANAR